MHDIGGLVVRSTPTYRHPTKISDEHTYKVRSTFCYVNQGISKYSKGIDKRPEQGWKRLLTSLLMPCRNNNNIQYNTNSYVNKDIHLSDVGFRLTHRVVAYQIFG